jgi:hypothetical protein
VANETARSALKSLTEVSGALLRRGFANFGLPQIDGPCDQIDARQLANQGDTFANYEGKGHFLRLGDQGQIGAGSIAFQPR